MFLLSSVETDDQMWIGDQMCLRDRFGGSAVLALFLLCVPHAPNFCQVSKLQEMDLAPYSMFQDRAEPESRLASMKLRLDLLPVHLCSGKEKKFSACLEQT